QRAYGLIVDGIVGQATWNAIYAAYSRFNTTVTPDDLAPQYPGIAIKNGASGTSVQQIQQALNIVGQEYTGIPVLVEDGVFGAETERAVRRFQELFNLDVDGIVGVNTWNKLFEVSKAIQQGSRPSPTFPTFPGTLLQSGSRGTDVRLIQERLNFIAMYYKNIPTIVADGIYGPLTTNSVRAFQTMLGLSVDGIVGLQTWDKIMQMYNELAN
ncbi:MAG TPA: peptidoglycan-binding protein, partial [Dielma fastidiosa]|nr:peptidoglycan-binding protein [Dielma fastidiosa]